MSRRFAVLTKHDVVVLPESASTFICADASWSNGTVAVDGALRLAFDSTSGAWCPLIQVDDVPADIAWHYAESTNVWRPLPASSVEKLEVGLRVAQSSVLPRKSLVVTMNAVGYEVDFKAMTQRNMATDGVRSIRRVLAAHSQPILSDLGTLDVVEVQPQQRPPRSEASRAAGTPLRRFAAGSASPTLRLVFPSLSTSVFKFDIAKAAHVAVAEVAGFLAKYPPHAFPQVHLTLLDFDPEGKATPTVAAFSSEWVRLGGSDPRFTFAIGDFADPSVRGACFAVANAANERFAGGSSTSGFNRAVHLAAGASELQADTRARYTDKGTPGVAYDVALRPTSPLLQTSGTRHVIHLIGPNMNPARPNCLHGDYEVGCAELRKCYRALFDKFASLAML